MELTLSKDKKIKPFVKWAGGKSQLLSDIKLHFPASLGTDITKYAEPFVGGGAVLFEILKTYSLSEVFISDKNSNLINTYITIRDNIDELIKCLTEMQNQYYLLDKEAREEFFYRQRELYNNLIQTASSDIIQRSGLFIFLNKTCYNGLYRVNKKGLFNVPFGKYAHPVICDELNLRAVSQLLQNVTISCCDYSTSQQFIDEKTFAYFDPPYRPITKTAAFTSYNEFPFNDDNQIELAKFLDSLSQKGAYILASNSDPKNANPDDDFFEDIYTNFNIECVRASRMINSNGKQRGKINELLISNYQN